MFGSLNCVRATRRVPPQILSEARAQRECRTLSRKCSTFAPPEFQQEAMDPSSCQVTHQFQNLIEKCVRQDAKRAFELGRRHLLGECAEKMLEMDVTSDVVQEVTGLSLRDIYSFGRSSNASTSPSQATTAPAAAAVSISPLQHRNKFTITSDAMDIYLDQLSTFTIISFVQRDYAKRYNAHVVYKLLSAESIQSKEDRLAEERERLIMSWQRKTGRKFVGEVIHLILPLDFNGPLAWWNILGLSKADHSKAKRMSPFREVDKSNIHST